MRRARAVRTVFREGTIRVRARTAVSADQRLRFYAIAAPIRDKPFGALLREKHTLSVGVFLITILAYENKIATPVGVGFITLPAG